MGADVSGTTGGGLHSGLYGSLANQWSAITAQSLTSIPPGSMQSSAWLLLQVPERIKSTRFGHWHYARIMRYTVYIYKE